MKSKTNNQGDRITPIALFFVVFPAIATIFEFINTLSETIGECQLHDTWYIYIPISGMIELCFLCAITAAQYFFAERIARWKGWCEAKVCSGIEIALLLYALIT